MEEHQEHFGRKFYKDKKIGYWISVDFPRTRAHRWVWINIHGKIPPKYHIHHKDENKSNNSIENLELIQASRHMSIHMQCPERRKFASKLCGEIRHLTKAWHSSEEGLRWHKINALKCNFGNGPLIDYVCEQCSKPFQSKVKGESRAKFCSNNCKSQSRRNSGLDDIEKVCPTCSNVFIDNRYSKQKYCGRSCAHVKSNRIESSKRMI